MKLFRLWLRIFNYFTVTLLFSITTVASVSAASEPSNPVACGLRVTRSAHVVPVLSVQTSSLALSSPLSVSLHAFDVTFHEFSNAVDTSYDPSVIHTVSGQTVYT